MQGLSPPLMELLSVGCFGAAAALLGIVAYRGMQGERLVGTAAADPSMRRAEQRRRALDRSPALAFFLVWLRVPAVLISRLSIPSVRNYVRAPYARAGYPGGLEDDEVVALGFLASLAAAAFVAFSAGVVLGGAYAWFGLCALPLGFLGLVSTFKTRAEARERQIVRAMPYVLDLLVLILRSGSSLTIALQRVVADYSDHPIGEELGQVLAEMDMGSTRVEALRRLAARVKGGDLNALSDSIVQSEELGWPLADTLQRQA